MRLARRSAPGDVVRLGLRGVRFGLGFAGCGSAAVRIGRAKVRSAG